MRKPLPVVTVVCVAAAVVLTGCSSQSRSSGPATGTDLSRALTRVAATDLTRTSVRYDATAKLTKLVGKQVTTSGFGGLLLTGTDLGPLAQVLAQDTGIAALDAEFGISAGLPPYTVSVLAGGQQPDRVGSALTTFGWTRNGDRYVAPAPTSLPGDQHVLYALNLAQVRADGADLLFGKSKADLGTIGHPSGRTLADDQPTSALADCLGDVVVAEMTTGYQSPIKSLPSAAQQKLRPSAAVEVDKLTEIAVGVRTPTSASDTPRAVVCTAWSDKAAADAYAAALPGALASGLSLATNQPYAQVLHNPETKNLGGGAHIVEWSADEVNRAGQVITMLQRLDMPGLF